MSLANELRDIASNSNEKKSAEGVPEILNVIHSKAKVAANDGQFSISIALKSKNWSRSSADLAAIKLRAEGFIVEVVNEITAWYSNTDCASEDFIKVSWK